MTPKRKQALQWFHDRGEVSPLDFWPNGNIRLADRPTDRMIIWMECDDQLEFDHDSGVYRLTNAGRQDLHEG